MKYQNSQENWPIDITAGWKMDDNNVYLFRNDTYCIRSWKYEDRVQNCVSFWKLYIILFLLFFEKMYKIIFFIILVRRVEKRRILISVRKLITLLNLNFELIIKLLINILCKFFETFLLIRFERYIKFYGFNWVSVQTNTKNFIFRSKLTFSFL